MNAMTLTKAAGTVGVAVGMAMIGTAANAQISVVSVSGLVRATAGNGSGSNQQTSSNVNGFSIGASKSFTNGSVSSQSSWTRNGTQWSGSFSSTSFAPSTSEAGWAESDVTIDFNLSEPMDLEYSGGYSSDSFQAFASIEFRNRVTNGYVAGGQSPSLNYLPAGQYRLTMNTFNPFGSQSGGFNARFRPGNDRCINARLVGNGIYTGSTTDATIDGSASCGSSNSSRSVWFKYTATESAPLVITTCGSGFDTVVSVYDTTSCPSGTGTQIACNDDAGTPAACAGTTQSAVTINAAAGSTYYIRVAGFNGAFGDYVLNVGPTNDRCGEAMVITPGTYPFDNRHASTDGPVLNQCTNNGADNQINGDLWYVYTPTQSGTINVATCGSSFDTKLAVYANAPCGPRFTYKACNDDACGFQSAINGVEVAAGIPYYIRVGGYLSARGTGTLQLVFNATPCDADFDGDGFVDFFDFDAFVQCFEGDTCPPGKTADFDGDGFVDFFDLDAFVNAYETGC